MVLKSRICEIGTVQLGWKMVRHMIPSDILEEL